jgi:hypothetical protein
MSARDAAVTLLKWKPITADYLCSDEKVYAVADARELLKLARAADVTAFSAQLNVACSCWQSFVLTFRVTSSANRGCGVSV